MARLIADIENLPEVREAHERRAKSREAKLNAAIEQNLKRPFTENPAEVHQLYVDLWRIGCDLYRSARVTPRARFVSATIQQQYRAEFGQSYESGGRDGVGDRGGRGSFAKALQAITNGVISQHTLKAPMTGDIDHDMPFIDQRKAAAIRAGYDPDKAAEFYQEMDRKNPPPTLEQYCGATLNGYAPTIRKIRPPATTKATA